MKQTKNLITKKIYSMLWGIPVAVTPVLGVVACGGDEVKVFVTSKEISKIKNFLENNDITAHIKQKGLHIKNYGYTYYKNDKNAIEIPKSSKVKKEWIILNGKNQIDLSQKENKYSSLDKLHEIIKKLNQTIFAIINEEEKERDKYFIITKVNELKINVYLYKTEIQDKNFLNFYQKMWEIISNSKKEVENTQFPYRYFTSNRILHTAYMDKKELTLQEKDEKKLAETDASKPRQVESRHYFKNLAIFNKDQDWNKFFINYNQLNKIDPNKKTNWYKNEDGENVFFTDNGKYKIIFQPFVDINNNKLKVIFYFFNGGKPIINKYVEKSFDVINPNNVVTKEITIKNAIPEGNSKDYQDIKKDKQDIKKGKEIINNFLANNSIKLFSKIFGGGIDGLNSATLMVRAIKKIYPEMQVILNDNIKFLELGKKIYKKDGKSLIKEWITPNFIDKIYNNFKNDPKININWLLSGLNELKPYDEDGNIKKEWKPDSLFSASAQEITNLFYIFYFVNKSLNIIEEQINNLNI